MTEAASQEKMQAIVQLCAFRVGDEEYVLDLMRVREIIQPEPVTAVPRASDFVEGVINLRGQVIPLVDVRKRLGLTAKPNTRKTKFLIVKIAGRVFGLLVDGVSEVIRIPRSSIQPAPDLAGLGGPKLFLGVCGTQGSGKSPARMRLLLNVKALLEPSSPAQWTAAHALAKEMSLK